MRKINPGLHSALLYLLAGGTGVFSYMYVKRTLVVARDAAMTAQRILDSEMLFRLGIASELISSIALVFLVLSLHRIFRSAGGGLALLMVILVLVSVPVSLLNVTNEIAALRLVKGGAALAAIPTPQLQASALLFLRVHEAGLFVAQIFWGLWLIPLGLLVRRSDFVPRSIGTLLIINGVAYPAVTLVWLLLPDYLGPATRIALVPQLGEAWFVLWLLIKGAPTNLLERTAPERELHLGRVPRAPHSAGI